jgi:hypothetical protein
MTTIRLWRLGYIDRKNPCNSVIPSADAIQKLKDLIKNNTSGGILDIIWGPDISLDVYTHPDGTDVVDVVQSVEDYK